MKISKLFHWLYAFLMFLPIFFVLGKGLYVTFNKNAKDSYYGETINAEIIETTNFYNLQLNTRYTYTHERENLSFDSTSQVLYLHVKIFDISTGYYAVGNADFDIRDTQYIRFQNADNYYVIQFYDTYTSSQYYYVTSSFELVSFSFELLSKPMYSSNYLADLFIFNYSTYNKYSYLDNAIDYGMYQLNESNLFAWVRDSFLSTPISYITNLFNMPSNSPVITALSYWLNISIIWLTFDVIMYVPLLTHRWLDKGVRE